MVDENGTLIRLKNNAPKYMLVEFFKIEEEHTAADEDVMVVSKRLIDKSVDSLRNLQNNNIDTCREMLKCRNFDLFIKN